MSYILEALKRSQHEHQLSQAPTLASAMAAANNHSTRLNFWLIAALLLAFTSMAIAIYAVTLLQTSKVEKTSIATNEKPMSKPIQVPIKIDKPVQPKLIVTKPNNHSKIISTAPHSPKKSSSKLLSKITVPKITESKITATKIIKPIAPPIVPIPIVTTKTIIVPPKVIVNTKKVESKPTHTATITTPISKPQKTVIRTAKKPELPATSLPKTNNAVAKNSTTIRKKSVSIPTAVAIPTDVAIAVEEFKHSLRKKNKLIPKPALLTVPPTPNSSLSSPPPTADTLPREVQARLPEHRIMVHAYDKTTAQRFVIINSQRLQEGGQTSNGLQVESIRPDGVVLKFQDQKFFKPR